jgi:multidrug efflux pump subunit AcrB
LPAGVLGPFANDEYSDVSFGLYALKAKGMPMRELVRRAEVIRQDLLHVPGVKKINILGERPEQTHRSMRRHRVQLPKIRATRPSFGRVRRCCTARSLRR